MTMNGTGAGELHEVWARRAAELAQPLAEEEVGERLDLAIVRLGGELYGLEAHHVTSLQPLRRMTAVPRVPAWVAGIVNLRGRMLSVLDLAAFWGRHEPPSLHAAGPEREAALVVVESPAMELALLVDRVLAVESVPAATLYERQSAVGLAPNLPADWVRGAYARHSDGQEEMVLVLDVPALLSDPRLIVDEREG